MIRKMLKAVARAAVAQPWDYQGEGAPNEWEFRVSGDEEHFAVYDPGRGHWVILDSGRMTVQAEVHDTAEMDKHTADWDQFVAATEPDG